MKISEENRSELEQMFQEYDLPTGAVDRICNENPINKREINDLLGLNEENEFRKVIQDIVDSTENLDSYPDSLGLVKSFCNFILELRHHGSNFIYLTLLVKSNKFYMRYADYYKGIFVEEKLSSFLDLHKKFWLSYIDHSPKSIIRDVLYELGLTTYEGDPDFSKTGSIVTKLFQMAGVVGKLIISTNPLDIVGINYNASYSSCYSIGSYGDQGCHFGATTAHAVDSISAALFVQSPKKKKKKIGRSWAFIFPDDQLIVQPKSYGTFNQLNRSVARKHLEKCLDPNGDWKSDEMNYRNHSTSQSPIYFDSYDCDVSWKDADPDYYADDLPRIKFAPGVCIECGEDTNYADWALCENCKSEMHCCSQCEAIEQSDDEGVYFNDAYFCSQCAERYLVTCAECGEIILDDDSYSTDEGGVCESCYYDCFTTCNHCDETIRNDETVDDGLDVYCSHCAEEELEQCEECGSYNKPDVKECFNCEADLTEEAEKENAA